jgi:4-hydroxy-tetrahydrodipicolinate reductase
MLTIAIVGYGKMGRRIEELAPVAGMRIGAIIDAPAAFDTKLEALAQCDVALEFTTPEAAPDNIARLLRAGLDVVSGTTGWLHRLDEAATIAEIRQRGLMVESNFSIGMNLFFELNKRLAKLMVPYNHLYQVSVEEVHHIHKLDSPSGTAKRIAADLQDVLPPKVSHGGCSCCAAPPEVPVMAKREGEVIGIHDVVWKGTNDLITIHHEAVSRDGFVGGALAAAKWIHGKTGLQSMSDMLFGGHGQ